MAGLSQIPKAFAGPEVVVVPMHSPPVALRGHLVDAEKRFRLIPRSRAGKPHLAFEKQLFTEWIFPPIVGAVIVALRPLAARGFIE